MICNQCDVVVVPFPLTENANTKRRKAIVLSQQKYNFANNATVMMMITSADNSKWEGDIFISDLRAAGLNKPCFARTKIFSIDNMLIQSICGHLGEMDKKSISQLLKDVFVLQESVI
ncbi:MAG: type II toxin-antitoxin system PemK/MazF family toxin [Silvanigrellaceae bacterium]|nr:type II toxin-antitoxin system PemK/MazF family toxin [Silvanigrellaceae bacterium]